AINFVILRDDLKRGVRPCEQPANFLCNSSDWRALSGAPKI
ncbi:hypothetical protein, partial [Methylomonas fluvii]